MEILLPYFIMMGAGIAGAIVVSLVLKKISIGIVGNCLAGMAGGISSSFLLKYLFIYIPATLASYAIIGLIAGALFMIAIGFARQLLNE